MPDVFGPPPEEDSDDLTDQEIAAALPTSRLDEIILWVKNRTCGPCGEGIARVQHERRRRGPLAFWRIRLWCSAGHETTATFSTPWLRS